MYFIKKINCTKKWKTWKASKHSDLYFPNGNVTCNSLNCLDSNFHPHHFSHFLSRKWMEHWCSSTLYWNLEFQGFKSCSGMTYQCRSLIKPKINSHHLSWDRHWSPWGARTLLLISWPVINKTKAKDDNYASELMMISIFPLASVDSMFTGRTTVDQCFCISAWHW